MSQFIYPNFPLARPNIWHNERGGGIFKSEPERESGAYIMDKETWLDHMSDKNFVEGGVNTISSAADLARLSWNVRAGVTYAGTTFKQTADINLGGYEWVPIGTGMYFSGTYDGQGYNIQGLFIYDKGNYDSCGLFGMVSEAELRDINLNGGSIRSETYTGSLAGMVYSNVNIYNCQSNVDVWGYSGVGGIVGYIDNDVLGSVVIEDCKYSGAVYGGGGDGCGGITGCANYAIINNCVFEGSVMSEDCNVGGIAGWSEYSDAGEISNCIVKANISGWIASGFGGSFRVVLKNCFFTGSVYGDNGSSSGGFFHNISSDSTIENCGFYGTSNLTLNMWGGSDKPKMTACYMWCNNVKQCSTATNTTNYWSQYWSIVPNINNGMPIQKELFSVANGVSTPESSFTSYFSSWTKV